MTLTRRTFIAATTSAALLPLVPTDVLAIPTRNSKWGAIAQSLNPKGDPRLALLIENIRSSLQGRVAAGDQAEHLSTFVKICLPITTVTYNNLLIRHLLPFGVMRRPIDMVGGIETEAVMRPISSRWTMEATNLPSPKEGVDVEAEIMAALAIETAVELNVEHVRLMREMAGSFPITRESANLRSAIEVVGEAQSADWVIVPADRLKQIGGSFDHATDESIGSFRRIGQIEKMAVYVDPFAPEDETVLFGRNSDDSGYDWSPYVLFDTGGIMADPTSFEMIMTFMTRHGTQVDPVKMKQNFTKLI